MTRLFVLLVKTYQKGFSPFLVPCCRFFPTCSSYAIEALQKYGVAKGLWLTARRLLKCHPFHPGGMDPVR